MGGDVLTAYIVKNAVFDRLTATFSPMPVYDEPMISRLEFPHLFVNQLTLNIRRADMPKRWYVDYFGTVRFRAVDRPETMNNLNERLDATALDLTLAFIEPLVIGNTAIRITQDQPSEKIDGVLHWFWNATLRVEEEVIDQIKMEDLDINTEVIIKE